MISHRRRRAAGRAARCVGRVVRVAGGAGREVGELGAHRFAQHHRPGFTAQGDRGGIGAWAVTGIDRRAVSGGEISRVKQVFDAHGQAMQQATHRASVQRAGGGQRGVGVELREGVDVGFALGDAL